MISLLEYLIKEITGNEDISINEETSSDVQVYYIKAPSSVIGSIIGKLINDDPSIKSRLGGLIPNW